MRWFKHLSTSHSNKKLSKYLDLHGAEGYGVWWLILERVALGMDKGKRCSAEYSLKKWAQHCHVSVKKFQSFVKTLELLGRITTEINENYLEITCPNLLKYRDEYSSKKKGGVGTVSGESLTSESESESEQIQK